MAANSGGLFPHSPGGQKAKAQAAGGLVPSAGPREDQSQVSLPSSGGPRLSLVPPGMWMPHSDLCLCHVVPALCVSLCPNFPLVIGTSHWLRATVTQDDVISRSIT